jgi:flavin reductase (DIM6/NTAB) family NADH-FMN oxidoreductase RutF
MFREISPFEIGENAIDLIGEQWMLVTAGKKDSFNTMTAAWGGFGFLWNMPVAYIFIRPQRYTYQFTEKDDFFTLCFFDTAYRNALTYCGSHSGKDVDKIKETGLIPKTTLNDNIYFEQAKLVIECEKIYFDDIKPEHFIDSSIDKYYPGKDYHRMYIGKIMQCLVSNKVK